MKERFEEPQEDFSEAYSRHSFAVVENPLFADQEEGDDTSYTGGAEGYEYDSGTLEKKEDLVSVHVWMFVCACVYVFALVHVHSHAHNEHIRVFVCASMRYVSVWIIIILLCLEERVELLLNLKFIQGADDDDVDDRAFI